MITLFIISLLIQPWIFLPFKELSDQFRLPQTMFMDFVFLFIIAWSFYYGSKYIYRNKYFAIFVGYIFLNFFVYFIIPFSLMFGKGVPNAGGRILNIACLEPMIHIILGLWALYILLSNIEREDLLRIAKALCISSCFVAIFGILQYFKFDPLASIAKYNCDNRVSACLDNPNLVGMYLSLCVPLFFIFLKNIKYIAMFALVLTGVLVTNCHFAIILSMIAIWLFLLIYFRKNKIVVASLLLTALAVACLLWYIDFAKMFNNMGLRLIVWKESLNYLHVNPLFGMGIGIYKTLGINTSGTMWYYAHSDWLERAIEIGFVGICIMILVVVNSIRNFKFTDITSISYFCMFITFLLMMIASFPLEISTIAVLGMISFIAVEKL